MGWYRETSNSPRLNSYRVSEPTTRDACIRPTVTRLPRVGSSTELTWLRTPETVTAANRRELVSSAWAFASHTRNTLQSTAAAARGRATEQPDPLTTRM